MGNEINNLGERTRIPKSALIIRVVVNLFIIFALTFMAVEKYSAISDSNLALTIVVISIIAIIVFTATTILSIYKYMQNNETT